MRIGQLARRLGIGPSDIVEFLGNEDADTNSRLDDELVRKVVDHFAPEKLSDILKPLAEPTPQEVIVETIVEETIPEPVPEEEQPELKTESTPLEETPVEVIRVSKSELQGLKVLGKIDLPEPKKKPEPAPREETEQQRKEFQRRREQRDWKNPLEVKRQQEARAAENKRKEEALKQKEKRANHYYNKVKSVPTKAVRRFEDQTVVEDIEVKEPPKGFIGRFLHWLRN